MKTFFYFLLFCLSFIHNTAFAQLAAGDIAIVGVNTDGPSTYRAERNQDKSNEITPKITSSESTLVEPTVDLYKRLLRKSSWISCESSFLCDALKKLKERFPCGFTRSEEFEYLIEEFGHNRTRGELRSAIYLLYKAGYVIQQLQKQNDEHIFIADLSESECVMSKKIDTVLANRLAHLCKLHDISFIPELVAQLLTNSYSKKQLKVLIVDN